MSTEKRNSAGYPIVRGGRNSPITASIKKIIDRSTNKALPWIAAVLAGFAAGGVMVMCLLKPWEGAAARHSADLRSELSLDLARSTALAELARKEASTAKDMVDLERAQRKAKEGIRQ